MSDPEKDDISGYRKRIRFFSLKKPVKMRALGRRREKVCRKRRMIRIFMHIMEAWAEEDPEKSDRK